MLKKTTPFALLLLVSLACSGEQGSPTKKWWAS
jgi:hypothetical protein